MKDRQPHIVTIVQARCGSSRLPGKTMLPLKGKPLFIRQLERMKAARLCGTLIVATTREPEDDAIETLCRKEGIHCYRGHSIDLLDRHYEAARIYQADIVLKIPSDCPLIDPRVMDRVIGYFLDNRLMYDYVSNLHPATYPDGNDVEIMHFETLEKAWMQADRPFEREHTTPYIWERPDVFRIGNMEMGNGQDYSLSHRWTIDYAEDYRFVRAVFDELYEKDNLFSLESVLDLLDRRNDIYSINSQWAGVNWYRHHLDELTTVSASQTKLIDLANEQTNAATLN
jgi:spore coat polysaccharide biosynthesis protein SpsF